MRNQGSVCHFVERMSLGSCPDKVDQFLRTRLNVHKCTLKQSGDGKDNMAIG